MTSSQSCSSGTSPTLRSAARTVSSSLQRNSISFLTPFCSLYSSWSSWASLGSKLPSAPVAKSMALQVQRSRAQVACLSLSTAETAQGFLEDEQQPERMNASLAVVHLLIEVRLQGAFTWPTTFTNLDAYFVLNHRLSGRPLVQKQKTDVKYT